MDRVAVTGKENSLSSRLAQLLYGKGFLVANIAKHNYQQYFRPILTENIQELQKDMGAFEGIDFLVHVQSPASGMQTACRENIATVNALITALKMNPKLEHIVVVGPYIFSDQQIFSLPVAAATVQWINTTRFSDPQSPDAQQDIIEQVLATLKRMRPSKSDRLASQLNVGYNRREKEEATNKLERDGESETEMRKQSDSY